MVQAGPARRADGALRARGREERYYSVQLTDMYSFNYGYIGSRATGNERGLLHGRRARAGRATQPAGIAKVFRSETQFGLVIYRTQLFDAGRHRQREEDPGRLHGAAALGVPEAAGAAGARPRSTGPKFTDDAFKTDFPAYLDFLLQFCAGGVRRRRRCARSFASIGIGPGKNFELQGARRGAQGGKSGSAIKEGYEKIEKQRDEIGKDINGWRVGSAFGDRAFYNGDYLLRAAAALAGIYGNDAVEAMYPMAKH